MKTELGQGVIAQILELARWAPSGDNAQCWRFEIVDAATLVVYGSDTREHCLYDFQGRPSQMSLGALIENIVLAASGHGLLVSVARRPAGDDRVPIFDIAFQADPRVAASPLIDAIPTRRVQRRCLQTRRLSPAEQALLADAVGEDHEIVWLAGLPAKSRMARLLFANAKIRLTTPEAYPVHRQAIQWRARFSEDRMPDQSLGLDPLTLRIMRWAMQSWGRVRFLNTFLAGTVLPRIQMDFLPAIACAGHFVLVPRRAAADIDDYIAGGRALQRFWLTATRLGLQLQPQMTPLVFAAYVRTGTAFSQQPGAWRQAEKLTARLDGLLGAEVSERALFMGRIGAGPAANARSTRLPLDKLLRNRGDGPGHQAFSQ